MQNSHLPLNLRHLVALLALGFTRPVAMSSGLPQCLQEKGLWFLYRELRTVGGGGCLFFCFILLLFFTNHHPPMYPDSPRNAPAEVSTQHIKSLPNQLGHTEPWSLATREDTGNRRGSQTSSACRKDQGPFHFPPLWAQHRISPPLPVLLPPKGPVSLKQTGVQKKHHYQVPPAHASDLESSLTRARLIGAW